MIDALLSFARGNIVRVCSQCCEIDMATCKPSRENMLGWRDDTRDCELANCKESVAPANATEFSESIAYSIGRDCDC